MIHCIFQFQIFHLFKITSFFLFTRIWWIFFFFFFFFFFIDFGGFFFFFFFFFLLFRVAPTAYGSSQARVEMELQLTQLGIQAVSTTYNTAHGKCQILNPLSKASDQTHIFSDTSWVHNSQRELPS